MSGSLPHRASSRLAVVFNLRSLKIKAAAFVLAVPLLLPGMAGAHHNDMLTVRDSATTHSQQVENLRGRFNREAKDIGIFIIDRDWFQINHALNLGRTKDDTELRRRLLSEFIESRGGGRLMQESELAGVADDVLSGEGMAYVLRPKNGQAHNDNACVVYGHRDTLGQAEQMRVFLGLHPALHGDIARARLRQSLPLDILNRFTDYHEIGHCLDVRYLPLAGTMDDFSRDPAAFARNRHKAEMFAEVFALLMLARDGAPDIAKIADIRANMRLVSAAANGPLAAQMTQPGDPAQLNSYIYMLHGGIRAAKTEILARGLPAMRAMSMDDLRELAHKITDDNALVMDGADHAVGFMMQQKFDLDVWDRLRGQLPHLETRYRLAMTLKAEMNTALREMFDLSHLPADADIVGQLTYNTSAIGNLVAEAADIRRLQEEKLRDELIAAAGGKAATRETLVRAFLEEKQRLRAHLRVPDSVLSRMAALRLQSLPQALVRAVLKSEGKQDEPGLKASEQRLSLKIAETPPLLPR